jgi:hypothetical protein
LDIASFGSLIFAKGIHKGRRKTPTVIHFLLGLVILSVDKVARSATFFQKKIVIFFIPPSQHYYFFADRKPFSNEILQDIKKTIPHFSPPHFCSLF